MAQKRAIEARLAGVELYFDDLQRGRRFYRDVLGLKVRDEQQEHHIQFGAGQSFVCLERKGAESYPSLDKAVLFFEVADLADSVRVIGGGRILESDLRRGGDRQPWAVLHDPEGHNIVLLEAPPLSGVASTIRSDH